MGNPKAFLEIHRQEAGYRPIHDRIHDFGEVEQTLNTRERKLQASRCMDCGVPFCHWACPLGNKAPEWNDALYKGDWELAYRLLNSTNPFPEFTGRICPALCEKACVLNRFNHEPTTNREDEAAITEMAFQEGFITPKTDIKRNGKKVAVIGAGPAGLATANDLNLMGYKVTVFEKNEAAGGLLRYGIPNFKLNKTIIDRRISLLEQNFDSLSKVVELNSQQILEIQSQITKMQEEWNTKINVILEKAIAASDEAKQIAQEALKKASEALLAAEADFVLATESAELYLTPPFGTDAAKPEIAAKAGIVAAVCKDDADAAEQVKALLRKLPANNLAGAPISEYDEPAASCSKDTLLEGIADAGSLKPGDAFSKYSVLPVFIPIT